VKRRGFLQFLGLGAGAAAGVDALARTDHEPSKGIVFESVCPNPSCAEKLSQFIDLTQPLRVGNQCPRCFHVIDLGDDLGRQMAKWNDKHAKFTGYRPRNWK
jgi:hypothetical protein